MISPQQSTEYVFGKTWDKEGERLAAAAARLDPGTIRHLEALGVTAGWTCLEAGAGGGSIAKWLAERAGPSGRVVATDLDTRQLDRLSIPNLEVRRHDLAHEPLEPATYDLAHARLLLEHLPERDMALANLVQSLKPGGWLMVEDYDYVSGVPVSELGAHEHAYSQSVRLQLFESLGHESMYGRRLPALLRAAGLQKVDNEGRVWVMQGGSVQHLRLSWQNLRPRLVGTGRLTEADIDHMLELFDNPEWSAFTAILMAVWGQRPLATEG
jgi:SAM-dependent methyltransferase